MSPKRKPWYRTRWGLVIGIFVSPFWFIWKKSRRSRLRRTLVGGGAALLVFILLATVVSHAFSSKSIPPAYSDNGTSVTSGGSTTSSITLRGYGATLSDWNASHSADNSFTANTTYDPTSGLGNGYNDKYTAVLWIGGRALGYQMGFPDGTSIDSAKNTVMQEFPSDATILWQQQNNSDPTNICYQMEVKSTTLGQVLQNDGNTFVEFQTIATSDTSTAVGYYPNNVNNASLRNADYKNASSVGGC
jgi:hypothetical protein